MKNEQAIEQRETKESLIPPVPLTLEGWSILHQMFRVRWLAWKALSPGARKEVVAEAGALWAELERSEAGQSGLFSLLGHKGDLLVLHFRRALDELNDTELRLANLKLAEFLEATTSYLSVVELGLYEASVRLYAGLQEKGLQPNTSEWNQAVEAEVTRLRQVMAARLWPEIPPRRYLCFYPMDKKRGELKNWYQVSITDRQKMMSEHGLIGRRYAGQVTQIISGSVGFDDWEWGVDLFADDPLVFKKLVYEMRFDEASAVYGLFGTFYVGLRFPAGELGTLLDGRTPAFVQG
ncbi:MAG TPA: hydrogen peroxide-dependent heme synthase [Candidatus Binatia bacterium]|nr:hydrogen peroxide-dependent heme synthase [Candidatus Binatia bacterium]